MHYILYYSFLVVSIFFAYFAWDKRFFFSISNFSLLFVCVFIALPGINVADRFLTEYNDLSGFSLFFFLYLYSFLAPPLCILIGRGLAYRRKIPSLRLLNYTTTRLHVISVLVILYSLCYYVYYYDQIPLFALITKPSIDRAITAVMRNTLTHNIAEFQANLPFIFRYRRLIMQDLGVITFLIWYSNYKSISTISLKKNDNKKGLLVFSFIIILNLILYLEKAPILTLVTYLVAINCFYTKKIPLSHVFLGIFLVMFTYVYFMGSSIESSFFNALDRLASQNRGVVEQYYIFKQNFNGELLFFRNYRFPLWDSLFGGNIVNLSSEAYKIIFSSYYLNYGIVGTTGSLHIFHLMTSFGLISALVLYCLYFIANGYFSDLMIRFCLDQNRNIYATSSMVCVSLFFCSVSIGGMGVLFDSSLFISPKLFFLIIVPILLGIPLSRSHKSS